MTLNTLYYHLKPFVPRWLQIAIRRKIVQGKRSHYGGVWPIDERAGKSPKGWKGWPEGKKFALVLTHDVETSAGQEKCRPLMEMEKAFGFRSSFGFVPERYNVSFELRQYMERNGFEVMVHGLYHDGKYYNSREIFLERAKKINRYLTEWNCIGYRSPSMQHNLSWIHALNIEYDSSTFDTDPFEPQADGVQTIFPFLVKDDEKGKGYIELPYTLPQDFTILVIMGERAINIWKRKLDWIVEKGGMALLITHPDYMNFEGGKPKLGEYPARHYEDFLAYIENNYKGQYWHALPRDVGRFWNRVLGK